MPKFPVTTEFPREEIYVPDGSFMKGAAPLGNK